MTDAHPKQGPFQRIAWPVLTPRLLLRPATPDDFPRLYELRAMPEVTRWLTGQPASLTEYVERYGTPERLGTTLVVEAAEAIVGDLFVSVETPYAQVEVRDRAEDTMAAIGWLVDPAYAGQGIATEAAAALLGICFDGFGVRRVVAGAFADNAASLRVMDKLGMRIEAREVRGSLHRDLGWVDKVEAAILVEEWRARRGD
jgi:RimJ/RimL family protein N-acetyltransferase